MSPEAEHLAATILSLHREGEDVISLKLAKAESRLTWRELEEAVQELRRSDQRFYWIQGRSAWAVGPDRLVAVRVME